MRSIVSVTNLTKRFSPALPPALNGLTFSVKSGIITGLAGPDGAGKTTLLRHIIGLMRGDSGSVSVLGIDSVKHAEKIREFSGYMPQRFGLYEDLTVSENLSLYADLCGLEAEKRPAKFENLLKFTSLAEFTGRLAGKLSGGMKQKLGLACVLLSEPQLLLLDEPSVGVDPISRRELWRMVESLLNEDMGVIWSTSYLDEAGKCGEVILLNEGKILFEGAPADILKNIEGRVYALGGAEPQERRRLLSDILNFPQVRDGIIQGKDIRVTLSENGQMPPLPQGVEARAVKPCFEDGYIDRLGGGPGGYSPLEELTAVKSSRTEAVIEADSLTKKFGSFTAVKNNTFTIKSGEIFGLLGPNGAGKSTTFKMMCGLLQPTSGTAKVMGLDLKSAASEARAKIGYMAQKFSLYGNLSVMQNLNFFSGVYGLSSAESKRTSEQMIEIFGLSPYANMNSEKLPLGFRQRLALACAVMHAPDVLFLDEPTSGVDPVTRREFWNHINGLVRKGVTIMVTTHFMDEAEYCDRIALIYKGENIAAGTPDGLKSAAKTAALPEPSLEDAFIELVQRFDREHEQ